jgi:hypothetical protein
MKPGERLARPKLKSNEGAVEGQIRFAELLALNHRQIDDAFMSALREHFTDPQIMELGTMIALYLGVGRLVAVLDLEGPACAIGGC